MGMSKKILPSALLGGGAIWPFIEEYGPEFVRSALYDQVLSVMKSVSIAQFTVEWAPSIVLGIAALIIYFEPWKKRRHLWITASALLSVLFVGYALLFVWSRPDDITWNFDRADNFFLGIGGDPVRVSSFQASGHNNTKKTIEHVSGYVRFESRNETRPIAFGVNGELLKPEDTRGIPPDGDFVIAAQLAGPGEVGIGADRFVQQYAPLTFVFRYDGKEYMKEFSRDDVRALIIKAQKSLFVPQRDVSKR